MRNAAAFLDGQKLLNVTVIPRGCGSMFEFDLGGCLETKSYNRKDEQWNLYEPSGQVLTLRADKKFSYGSGDTPESEDEWKSITGD